MLNNTKKTFNFLYQIRESLFTLENQPLLHQIQEILIESIDNFNYNLDKQTSNELFLLISSCLSHIPSKSYAILNSILSYSIEKPNNLIMTVHILSSCPKINSKFPNANIKSIVDESHHQIVDQIEKINDKNFMIQGQLIPIQFRSNFIIDILLITYLNEQDIKLLFPFIIEHANTSITKLKGLIQKVLDNGFIYLIPESILIQKEFLMIFSMGNLAKIIPTVTEQTFKLMFPHIEEILKNETKWSQTFSIAFIERCIEFDININSIEKLPDSFILFNMNESVWNYFAKYNFQLPSIAAEIREFPNLEAVLKVMPDTKNIPNEIIENVLLITNDLAVYQKVFNSSIENKYELFSSIQFWMHILNVFSMSENSLKCPESLLENFVIFFQMFVPKNKVFETIDAMIFDQYPTNDNANGFLKYLLDHFERDYKEDYTRNMGTLLNHVNEKDFVPASSFWELFDFNEIKDCFDKKILSPTKMYAYFYLNPKNNEIQIKHVKIQPIKNQLNNNLICEFIKNNDYIDNLTMFSKDILSLIMSAMIYATTDIKPKVKGLNMKNVLPFVAIVLNYLKRINNGHLLCLSPEIKSSLLKACQYLSKYKTSIFITSINSILQNLNYFSSNTTNSISLSVQNLKTDILSVLIPLLIQNSYPGDLYPLLYAIFNLTNKVSSLNEKNDLFLDYGINLFKHLIKIYPAIINYKDLKDIGFDFKALNSEKVVLNIVNIIENYKSTEIVINAIKFLADFGVNIPSFKLSNPINIINVFNDATTKENLESCILVGRFITEYYPDKRELILNESFPSYFKEAMLKDIFFDILRKVRIILLDTELDNVNQCLENIFDLLMTDYSIQKKYLIYLCEKMYFSQSLSPKDILALYSYEYANYHYLFIKAIDSCYTLNITSNIFVRRFNRKVKTSFRVPKIGLLLITFLYDLVSSNPSNYQAFFCLLNLSSAFPFLFNDNPEKLFNSVLPAFDYLSLYYTENKDTVNEETLNKIKASCSALIFLTSSLNSIIVLNSFINWIFSEIIYFTNSQVLAFVLILQSLFEIKKMKKVMISFAIKNNFIDIMYKLLKRNVDKKLETFFKNNIYLLIEIYYHQINKLKTVNIIYIDELLKTEDPLNKFFQNSYSTFPIYFIQLNLPPTKDQYLKDYFTKFFSNILYIRSFWINTEMSLAENNQTIMESDVDSFIKDYKEMTQQPLKKGKIDPIQEHYFCNCKVKFVRMICRQPYWVYKFFLQDKNCPLLPEYTEFLNNSINELIEVENTEYNSDDEKDISDISFNDYFMNYYCYFDLFDYLMTEMFSISIEDEKYHSLCSLIDIISMNDTALNYLLKISNNYLINAQNEKEINKLVDFFLMISNKNGFKCNFASICGRNLIDKVVSIEYRMNPILLLNTSKLFCCSNIDLELPINQLIGFMFILNDIKIIPQALELIQKVGVEKIEKIMPKIENVFDNELKSSNPSYFIISKIINLIPSAANAKHDELFFLFRNIRKMDLNKDDSIDLICSLYNFLTPKRNDDSQFCNISFEPNETNSQGIFKVPEKLKNTNRKFWNAFENNKKKLIKVIQKDINNLDKLNLLLDYPELFDFKIKMKYFQQKMSNHIAYDSDLLIEVDRSNVLSSTFNQLSNLSPNVWLSKLNIEFQDEDGIDQGGLTHEWFTLIIKELFDSKSKLFKITEKKKYQPDPLSIENRANLEYFNFAGMIVARALIQGQCINAHLTKSFYKKILNRKIKFCDLFDYDEDIYNSLKSLINIDVDPLELNFTIDVEQNGKLNNFLLKKNGDQIYVTNENKKEYINLYSNYHLIESIKEQMTEFLNGFYSLIPLNEICFFFPNELDLVLCGNTHIDVNDLQNNTNYANPYHSEHHIIRMFFKVISKWSNETLAQFLLFLTGSSQVPVNGFVEYKEKGNPITIAPGGDKDHLCVAHTCVNMLDLPQYENENEMNNKLLQSIQVCSFGLK